MRGMWGTLGSQMGSQWPLLCQLYLWLSLTQLMNLREVYSDSHTLPTPVPSVPSLKVTDASLSRLVQGSEGVFME